MPIVLAALACLPGSAAAARLVATDPALQPRFARAVTDYAVRCPDRTLDVRVRGAAARTVAIEPGRRVAIRVRRRGRTTRHFVRCVPDDFPGWRYRRVGTQVPRWFLLTPGVSFDDPIKPFVAVFDHHGAPLWWYRSPTGLAHDAQVIAGRIAYAESFPGSFGADDRLAFRIRRLDGTLVRSIQTVGVPTDFHDLQRVDGDYLLLAYRPRRGVDLSAYGGPADATVMDSEIQRVDRRGRLVWSWSSRDHIALAEAGRWWPHLIENPVFTEDGSEAYDPTHINSIERVGEDLLISLRHTDAVYRIRMRDGRVRWKLGGTRTRRSLRVVGDPADYPLGGPHDARLWRGTVTIHDNGTDLGRPPRAVRYAIDARRRTATLRESLADPHATSSLCCGSARKLEDGNWLLGWGGSGVSSLLTPRGGLVSRFTLDEVFSYRTVSAPERALSRGRLRAGMDALYAAGDAD